MTSLNNLINKLNDFKNLSDDIKFKEFIKVKCMETLNKITDKNIESIVDEKTASLSQYRKNHTPKIINNGIRIYNETLADLSELSEKTKKNYINGFSVAKAVEYGVGIVGKKFQAVNASKDGWVYNVNDHKSGWVYKNNGKYIFTSGYKGRQIYYYTLISIQKNIEKWIYEYIKMNIKE